MEEVEAEEVGKEIILPLTGELVDRTDVEALAEKIRWLRDLSGQIRDAQRILGEAVADIGAVEATGTFHLEDGSTLTIGASETTEYDIEALETELRFAGMPEEILDEIIETTVTRKVKAARIKRAASRNPTYAEIIERNSRKVEKTPYVSISSPSRPVRR